MVPMVESAGTPARALVLFYGRFEPFPSGFHLFSKVKRHGFGLNFGPEDRQFSQLLLGGLGSECLAVHDEMPGDSDVRRPRNTLKYDVLEFQVGFKLG